jgi:hypothetical protein
MRATAGQTSHAHANISHTFAEIGLSSALIAAHHSVKMAAAWTNAPGAISRCTFMMANVRPERRAGEAEPWPAISSAPGDC